MVSIAALVLSNVVFLAIRGCVRHKVDNSSEKSSNQNQFAGVDSIIAIRKHLQMFNSTWVPTIVAFLVYSPWF